MCSLHTRGYSATKRSKVLTHATTWMDPENIPVTKGLKYDSTFMRATSQTRTVKITETEIKMVVARD